MRNAGKYLQLAQGVGEAALLGHLRSKYKMQFNLPRLAQLAKDELRERQMPITPGSLVQMADELASREVTMLEEMVGIDYTRWNPATKEYEEYTYPDPREYFIR
jgi:hypothetical protein